jgi:hypothetical protein
MRHDLAAEHKTSVGGKKFTLSLATVHHANRGYGFGRFLSTSLETERSRDKRAGIA